MLQVPLVKWLIEQLSILGKHLTLFLILIALLFVIQRLVFLLSEKILGGKSIYLSAWIGTPIHELSHALFCCVFGHKIQRIVLFNPDRRGTLGYVTHSYNNRNIWQVMGNFFIGIAPLFGGLLALYIITFLMLDNARLLFNTLKSASFTEVNQFKFSELIDLTKKVLNIISEAYTQSPAKVMIWAYLFAAISLHLSPSKEDLKGAWVGFLIFISACLCMMLFNQAIELDALSAVKQHINVISSLYFIGVVLGSILLLTLFLWRVIALLFQR